MFPTESTSLDHIPFSANRKNLHHPGYREFINNRPKDMTSREKQLSIAYADLRLQYDEMKFWANRNEKTAVERSRSVTLLKGRNLWQRVWNCYSLHKRILRNLKSFYNRNLKFRRSRKNEE